MAKNTVQVKCINKDDRYNPYERITHIGGYTDKQWKITLAAAIKYIETDEWGFYVNVNGERAWIVVAISPYGNKYLKTQPDRSEPNNLLSLPECP